ncbi:MAG: hypothetical protein K8T91_03640 [Planctomycetes bacterium]|nr:hypothetical protein [Planctomycetota bacterium]
MKARFKSRFTLTCLVAATIAMMGCQSETHTGATAGAGSGNAPTVVANNPPPAIALDPRSVEKMTDYEKKIIALGGRPRLHLDFSGSKLTDDDLANLEALAMVTSMDLSYTNITDKGIEHLKKYPQLEKLTIVSAPITDASIEHFRAMKNLWVVDLDGTKVSQAGGMQLIKLLAPRANERLYRPKAGRPPRN